MPKLSINVPHALGQAEAIRRLQSRLDEAKAAYADQVKDLQANWEGNTLRCQFQVLSAAVAGTVRAEPDSVQVDADLPLIATMFQGTIEKRLRDELTNLLA